MTHPATPIDLPQIAPVQLAGSNVEFELDLSFVSSFSSAFKDVQGILCLSHHKNAYFLIALDAPCLTHVTYTSDLELNHSTHSTRKQTSAEAQHGVIWLYHGSGHLWAAPHCERDLALLAVVHRPLAMDFFGKN